VGQLQGSRDAVYMIK